MNNPQIRQINNTILELYNDSKNDFLKVVPKLAKSIFKPMGPSDFKNVYLSISKEQGEDLIKIITKNNLKNIVEFGTSFGISTLFLAQGAIETKGRITTTELIDSKAKKAKQNFIKAGVDHLIDIKTGNALESLKDYKEPIDFLLLDGWKDLYLPLFTMLEPLFHKNSLIYVDNANMDEAKTFIKTVNNKGTYHLETLYNGKAVLISI